jgi:hypothetical protein
MSDHALEYDHVSAAMTVPSLAGAITLLARGSNLGIEKRGPSPAYAAKLALRSSAAAWRNRRKFRRRRSMIGLVQRGDCERAGALQQRLYFRPLPHGQSSFGLTLGARRAGCARGG